MTINLCTIGFLQKNLRTFVELLERNHVTKLVDIRLNNTSQLSGYSKTDDWLGLSTFCQWIGDTI
ncbi:hypothetical protein C2I06_19605 [Niallia circulans]|nr:hypothetical protein C2I06_19605 [Niallia circulans]